MVEREQDGLVSPDLFAQFTGRLSRYLQEPVPRSADVAAQMYISRSVLDRLVKAAAGEPPTRLLRRLLLERAATRLRAPGATVTEVAMEAGYSSPEAFSRAFRRAYAATPSAWRRSAGPIHTGPRRGLHFYPPGGLRVAARHEESAMDFLTELVDQHLAVLGHLLDRAATLTGDQLDAPLAATAAGIDRQPTIRSLLGRLVGQMEMWGAAMASRPYYPESDREQDIAALRGRLAAGGQDFAAYVREICREQRFGETYVDATGKTPFVFTAAGMIAHVLTYAAYRRTVLVGALAAAGAADIDDDPLTWFAP